MAIHNKSHNNSALRSILKQNKENIKNKTSVDFKIPEKTVSLLINEIWLVKTDKYYFDLDFVRVKYSPEELKSALKDKRLIPENVMKGKNPTNVWEIGRLIRKYGKNRIKKRIY